MFILSSTKVNAAPKKILAQKMPCIQNFCIQEKIGIKLPHKLPYNPFPATSHSSNTSLCKQFEACYNFIAVVTEVLNCITDVQTSIYTSAVLAGVWWKRIYPPSMQDTSLGGKRTRTSDSTVVSTASRLFLVWAFFGASPKPLLQSLSPTLLI